MSLVIFQYHTKRNALEFRRQAVSELLSEDLPSHRPRNLVGEDHFANLLEWSNLPTKKGLKFENHSNTNIDSRSNINSNIIELMSVL